MNLFRVFSLFVLGSAFLIVGCASDEESRSKSATMPPPSIDTPGTTTTTTTIETTTTPTQTPSGQTTTQTTTTTTVDDGSPKPLSSLPTKRGYPYGIKTKWPGLVKSPYAQDKTLVDVNTYASGSPVRCPHTNKIFIVP